ncbi:2,3-bisphosphoglycerate-dependent phosphoglycerate mutase [Latilactobacillus graminis]|uniref:2,3-bisphosphoglycerate-dependent phosphoglycerate mutase n=2 Tax=Latilactobacillus graminis TaxID=60519 RepID=A0AA89I2P6_9LACO|nr:2,3-diphosphoglycerate-dependent phosphoglycerate mutase [Latilactobacillus graminis]KRM23357.1 phosphoglycerate mutase 1 family protein [Latilactobacillus graminis DSM 20719]QFP80290.1 2,3-diphosphoglycerate-dependent phosphoglycerate mutase [Latilactobacillus graminis]
MANLLIVRHGESLANQLNTYTGWSDVPLTTLGRQQARRVGQQIQATGIQFSHVHTSLLKRAILTSYIILDVTDQLAIPMTKSWRLNERHYGALRGLDKEKTRAVFGVPQVARWRRSYTAVPPLLTTFSQARRYRYIAPNSRPRGESLAQAEQRLLPYWQDQVVPGLLAGQDQLIVAHGSTLRALIKIIEQISDQDIDGVEVENGEALYYRFDSKMKVSEKRRLTD